MVLQESLKFLELLIELVCFAANVLIMSKGKVGDECLYSWVINSLEEAGKV